MTERRQRVKSIYFPGDPAGKGVVAVALQSDDPRQMALFREIEHLGSTELRELLGIADWPELEALAGEAKRSRGLSRSAFLRVQLEQRLRRRKPRKPLPRAVKEIRSAPPGTEDSLERANTYMQWVEDFRRACGVRGPVRLIDPFAGTGNFLVAAASREWESWYCENDPFARKLLELKIAILSRGGAWRPTLRRNLAGLAEQSTTLLDRFEQWTGASPADPEVEWFDAAWQSLTTPAARGKKLLDDRTLRRAIAARKVADLVWKEDPMLGGCFEIASAWAAASCAKPRALKRDDDFERNLRNSLSDFEKLCDVEETMKVRPQFLCEDARDLASFGNLGLNAVVTTLPSFEAVSQVLPPDKVRAWMLRQPVRGAGGTGMESLVRSTLDLVRDAGSNERSKGKLGTADDPRGLAAAEVSSFLFDRELPRASHVFVQLRNALGAHFDAMRDRILRAEKKDETSAPTLRRAGLTAVRYFAMIAQAIEGLLAVRDTAGAGGLAIIEVEGARVVDMHVDTPEMVATYLEAAGAARVDRRVIARKLVRASEGETIAREVLVYGLPEMRERVEAGRIAKGGRRRKPNG
jgi:hypothetical protein